MTEHGAKRVFISHCSHDRQTGDALKNLICTALPGLAADQVLFTSLEGYGLPGGAPIDDDLRQKIVAADAVLAVISPESMASPYVLFELGARWGNQKDFIPLLVPGANASDLRGPAVARNALKCESDADLHTLVKQLGKALHLEPGDPSSYVGHFQAVKAARETRRAGSSIYRGFLHLQSTLFHEVEEDVRRRMSDGGGVGAIIPTKYLFAHADSYDHYKRLVNVQGYVIAAEGNDLFINKSAEIADELLRKSGENRRLTVVSLGIGFGVKEEWLLKKLLMQRGVQISLMVIDQNPAFIQKAIEHIEKGCAVRDFGSSLSCEFLVGDFDKLDELASLMPRDRPTIFLALGGTFGNQNEKDFLQQLKRAHKGETYLLMDFDRIPAQASELSKGGYDSEVNKEFISSMFRIFCKEEPLSVEAVSSKDLFGSTISSVHDADVIVMVGEFKEGRSRYFGYSTRYDKASLEKFLKMQHWSMARSFDDPKWPNISLVLYELKAKE